MQNREMVQIVLFYSIRYLLLAILSCSGLFLFFCAFQAIPAEI